VFKVEETGHGDILSDEFINWRIKLTLNRERPETMGTDVFLPMDPGSVDPPG
jgi:RAT1-interacting protein